MKRLMFVITAICCVAGCTDELGGEPDAGADAAPDAETEVHTWREAEVAFCDGFCERKQQCGQVPDAAACSAKCVETMCVPVLQNCEPIFDHPWRYALACGAAQLELECPVTEPADCEAPEGGW